MAEINKLSALQVKNAKHDKPEKKGPILKPDGGGLYLQVSKTAKDEQGKSWVLRYTRPDGKRTMMGLGRVRDVPLAEARIKAQEQLALVRDQLDPVRERQKARQALADEIAAEQAEADRVQMTFSVALDKYTTAKHAALSSEKYRLQWTASVERYAVPIIGDMPVTEITKHHLMKILEPHWETKTVTMAKLRGRIENVLDWCKAHGHREGDNPAAWKGNLKEFLPDPTKLTKTRHMPAVQQDDLAAWFAALCTRTSISATAVQFLAYTAVRSQEVRFMDWSEVKQGLWTIPATRMKMKKEHVVPLSDAAQALLNILPSANHRTGLVFPAVRGGALSDMALSMVMRKMFKPDGTQWVDRVSGDPVVPHGLRSSFRDWAANNDYDYNMAEIALAHNVGSSVTRAYLRSGMVEKRRGMMNAWANKLLGKVQADD